MLPISGQTAEPIGLNFFVDTHRRPWGGGGCLRFEKTRNFFFQNFLFSRATPGPSASFYYYYLQTSPLLYPYPSLGTCLQSLCTKHLCTSFAVASPLKIYSRFTTRNIQ